MALSQMQVFNEFVMPLTIERLGQMIDKFNAASRGAIQLSTEGFSGDFMQSSFFASLATAQRRVDRYASQASVTPVDLTQARQSTVKVAGGFGPIRYEPSQMTWLNNPTSAAVDTASIAFAELLMRDQLNTAILALRAAMANVAAATLNVSPAGGISQASLNNTDARFGDRSGALVARVMTGSVYHKLIGQNLTNAAQLFTANNVTVVDVLGKVIIVTDAPALFVAGSPALEHVLTLTTGAAMVMDGSTPITNIQTNNGQTRIETTMQVDYDFGLGLKGYTWDETNGGKSPIDSEIGTGTNWDLVVGDVKNSAGVLTIGNAAV